MKRKLLPFLSFALAACICVACDTNPNGPTQTPNSQITQVYVNVGGAPSTSPSPGASPAAGTVHSVKVSQFGEGNCNSGVSPSGQSRSVRVGCTAFLTCTPKRIDGTDASPLEHGPRPDFFGVVGGAVYVSTRTNDEPFNLDVRGVAPGVASFQCVAKGVSSGSPPWDLTVVP